MPYQKSKERAFQDAEQRVSEVKKASSELVVDSADFASQLSHLKNEVNKAYQQVENALEIATETQRKQLEKYQTVLSDIVEKVNEYE
jgi:two-component sensor histidine kinase